MKAKLLLLVAALVIAVPTFAGTIGLDFSDGGATGGTITVLGGSDATGVDIPIGLMKLTGYGPDQLFAVTGNCAGGTGCLSFDTSANTLTIVGTADGVTGTLLSGTVDGALAAGLPLSSIVIALGTDVKDPELLAALGIGFGHSWDYLGTTIGIKPLTGETYTAISTDVANTSVTPEPMSMLLLGTFLSLGGGMLSRKKRA